MNLLRLRYFIEVARCGSFSRAARQLYTAQPNLSKQIAQMEQELGVTLFARNHHSVTLTPPGEYLYRQLQDLPDQLDAWFDHARQLEQQGAGRLSIGVLEGQDLNRVLHGRLALVKQTFPELELTMERSSYQHLRNGLASGHYDLIITLSFDVEDNPELAPFTLFEKSPAVVMRRDHPLADKQNIDIADLKDARFVVISQQESPGGYARLMESCARQGFTPHVVKEPNSLESLLLYVEMGEGIAILDQNTRLELSPYVVTRALESTPMAVVAVIPQREQRQIIRRVVEILSTGA